MHRLIALAFILLAVPASASPLKPQPQTMSEKVQALADQGKFPEAVSLLEDELRTLASDSAANGEEIMLDRNSLGNIRMNQGDYAKAEALFNQVLFFLRKEPEKYAQNIAIVVNNLSIVYNAHAEYRKGLNEVGEALRILAKYEPGSAMVEAMLMCQGSFQHDLGLHDSAIATDQKCLKAMAKHLGPDNLNFAALYNNLGEVYYSKGDFRQAMVMYEKSRTIFAMYWKDDDPNFSSSYNNLGKTEFKLGNAKKAEELLLKAVSLKLKRGDESDQDLLETYENLSALYQSQGKKAEGGKYAALAKKIRSDKDVSGKTGTILNKMAEE